MQQILLWNGKLREAAWQDCCGPRGTTRPPRESSRSFRKRLSRSTLRESQRRPSQQWKPEPCAEVCLRPKSSQTSRSMSTRLHGPTIRKARMDKKILKMDGRPSLQPFVALGNVCGGVAWT